MELGVPMLEARHVERLAGRLVRLLTALSSPRLALVAAKAAAAGSSSCRISIMSAGLVPSMRVTAAASVLPFAADRNVPRPTWRTTVPLASQHADGAAHRVAGDAEFAGEVALRRHAAVAGPLAGIDAFLQRCGDVVGDQTRHGPVPI